MSQYKTFLRLVVSFTMAFIVMKVLSSNVFIANTPRIYKDAPQRLAQIPLKSLSSAVKFVASVLPINGSNTKHTAQLGSSVYAESSQTGSVTTLDMNKMNLSIIWVDTKKGNHMPIFVPEGQTPSENYIEYIKNNY